MRKLNRLSSELVCLSNYDHNVTDWSKKSPNKSCRKTIWHEITNMQDGFCVYCESIATKESGHIEHFFHKGKKSNGTAPYKHLTFNWNNLFGCCGLNSGDSCGHYKDRQGNKGPDSYNACDLIKPDIDDPREYFRFLVTGIIEPKPNLTGSHLNKAKETIRVLNLDSLNGARQKQIDIFKKELDQLEKMSHVLDEQTLQKELNDIRSKVKQKEYQTAVLMALFE